METEMIVDCSVEMQRLAVHLKEAILQNSPDDAQRLLRKFIDYQDANQYLFLNGESFMHVAAKNSNPIFCQMLYEHKFPTNSNHESKCLNVESPIFIALRNKNSETAQFLIRTGASLEGIDSETEFPLLAFACKQGNIDLVKLLIQTKKIKIDQNFGIKGLVCLSPLYIASMYGHFEIAKLLLEHGANVNHSLEDGTKMTPIFQSILRGDYKMTRLFVNYGAKINTLTLSGMSPLHLATQLNHPDIITLLLNRGANVHIKRPDKGTPLHTAADYCNPESFAILIRKGAKFTIRDHARRKALLYPTVSPNPYTWIKGGNPSPDAQIQKLKEWRMKPDECRKFTIFDSEDGN